MAQKILAILAEELVLVDGEALEFKFIQGFLVSSVRER